MFRRHKRVIADDVHVEGMGFLGDFPANPDYADKEEGLLVQFGWDIGLPESPISAANLLVCCDRVAAQHQGEHHDVLGYRDVILIGEIQDLDTALGGGSYVDTVVSCAVLCDYFQRRAAVDDLFCDLFHTGDNTLRLGLRDLLDEGLLFPVRGHVDVAVFVQYIHTDGLYGGFNEKNSMFHYNHSLRNIKIDRPTGQTAYPKALGRARTSIGQ